MIAFWESMRSACSGGGSPGWIYAASLPAFIAAAFISMVRIKQIGCCRGDVLKRWFFWLLLLYSISRASYFSLRCGAEATALIHVINRVSIVLFYVFMGSALAYW